MKRTPFTLDESEAFSAWMLTHPHPESVLSQFFGWMTSAAKGSTPIAQTLRNFRASFDPAEPLTPAPKATPCANTEWMEGFPRFFPRACGRCLSVYIEPLGDGRYHCLDCQETWTPGQNPDAATVNS